jgi:ferredoxin
VLGTLKETKRVTPIFSTDLHEIDVAIANCNIFIGCRMHSIIAAVRSEIPVIALAYSSKTLGLAKILNISDFTIDIQNIGYVEFTNEVTTKFQNLYTNYNVNHQLFLSASRKAKHDAKLHLKLVENVPLVSFFRTNKCTGCGTCVFSCSQQAINLVLNGYGEYTPTINFTKCVGCEVCLKVCPVK